METREFGVVTFKSTQYAMKADSTFKDENMNFKTIPTPREITKSCGLSIRFELEDIEEVKDIIHRNNLDNAGIFKITKGENVSKAERIN